MIFANFEKELSVHFMRVLKKIKLNKILSYFFLEKRAIKLKIRMIAYIANP